MTDGKIVFATLVATPTKTSWSQAYTAGKLYAVLSLDHIGEGADLAAKGKEIIGALVEEYFTLEEKNLDSIKAAVIQTSKKIPENLHASFVVVSLVNNIVYAYTFGGGKILLKRGEKVGSIISTPSHEQHIIVHAVSGYVENKDILILETKQFSEIVDMNDFAQSFSDPTEAVEILSPKVHGKENGGASAIVLSYTQEGAVPSLAFAPDTFDTPKKHEDIKEEVKKEEQVVKQPEEEEEFEEPKRSALEEEFIQKAALKQEEVTHPKKSRFSFPKLRFSFFIKLFLFLLVPLILLGVLGYTLYTTKLTQEEMKLQQAFDQIYPQAQKEYEQGEALLSLNKELAMDDFINAKKIIDDNINKFPQGSLQRQKMQELLTKIEQQGVSGDTPTGNTLEAKVTDADSSPLLTALSKNTKATYVTESNNTIYLGSNTDIQTSGGKVLIENGDEWKSMGGLGVYNGNIYVLDKSGNQILKYTGASKDNKSVYTSGNLSSAVSMSIDSSIYVLGTDGSIKKYTSGKQDTFTTTGLTKPLSNPTRIYTTAETDNVYVLDKGNSRVVSLSKSGTFQADYAATVIKTAQDFEVDETSKKLYVLSDKKIYEISMP